MTAGTTGSPPSPFGGSEAVQRIMFDAWLDAKADIQRSILHRWDVTKAFLLAMAAIIAGAVALIGALSQFGRVSDASNVSSKASVLIPSWLPWTMALFTLGALIVQIIWQISYHKCTVHRARRADALVRALNQHWRATGVTVTLTPGGEDDTILSSCPEDLDPRGIYVASSVMAIAASILVGTIAAVI